MIEYLIKERRIKAVSQLRNSIVKALTKGDAFRWLGEADEEERCAESRRKAEELADKMISENMEIIPSRIKRDR